MEVNWTVIRNPKAASGKGSSHWPRIQALLKVKGITYTEVVTQHPGHAMELAREAIAGGARHLLAVGGDGTVNEVANGILTQTTVDTNAVTLGQIPVGSGKDWGRTMGIPSKYADAIEVLKQGKTIVQDVGVVNFEKDGQAQRRYYVNIAGMGFDAFVGEIANQKKAAGKGGILAYVGALITALRQYKALPASITVDGKQLPKALTFSLVAGICKYNGGGMKQCPQAVYDDGLLDLTIIRDLSKWAVIRNIPGLFSGKFVRKQAVSQYQAKEIHIESPEMMLEVDGENIGQGSCTFRIIPAKLNVQVKH